MTRGPSAIPNRTTRRQDVVVADAYELAGKAADLLADLPWPKTVRQKASQP